MNKGMIMNLKAVPRYLRPKRFASIVAVITLGCGTLLAQPSITTQPLSQTALAGNTVVFSVTAEGAGPPSYQWQFNGTNLPNDIITRVVGFSSGGYSGDGGPATNARVDIEEGMAFDGFGNLYLPCDTRVRMVDTNGIITTVAGNGTFAYSGDGGPATNASLSGAASVAPDAFGNLYIVDGSNQRIRKVDTNGIITTVAGNGKLGYYGDGGRATNAELDLPSTARLDAVGNIYFSDCQNHCIRKVATNGIISKVSGVPHRPVFSGDGGQATNAGLYSPYGICFGSAGELFIADQGNGRVRKIDRNGIITTVAGNGSLWTYSGDGGQATNAAMMPMSVALDTSGNLYIADANNYRIRMVDTNGIITTAAGNGSSHLSGDGGAATNAGLYEAHGVAFDSAGNLFISTINSVRKVGYTGYPTLTLNPVSVSDAGSYTVVVTSSEGSVTSEVAILTVLLPPSISSITPQPDGTMALSFAGTPNSTNRLWVATNLGPPAAWSPLSTNVAGPDGTWQFTDSSAVGWASRFYRVSMP
jgi:sugar lactone lactonase YvrE